MEFNVLDSQNLLTAVSFDPLQAIHSSDYNLDEMTTGCKKRLISHAAAVKKVRNIPPGNGGRGKTSPWPSPKFCLALWPLAFPR